MLGIDAIKSLGRACINQTGEEHFTMDNVTVCAALKIDKVDVSIKLDWQKFIWTPS